MPTSTRLHWDSLFVSVGASKPLEGGDRLAALYRWYRGDRAVLDFHVAAPNGPPIAEPGLVDWTDFPTTAAIQAAARDRRRP